ncbi:MAG: polysaccharide biosynthesis protein [Victivallales bacterium]|nr:polysaccharide biosynthesis protein [Victivallales bacterium]
MLFIGDIAGIWLAYLLALFVRFDFSLEDIPDKFLHGYEVMTPYYAIICLAIYKIVHLYNRLWDYASYRELVRCIVAVLPTTILYGVIGLLFLKRMPISYYVLGGFFQLVLLLCSRFCMRIIKLLYARSTSNKEGKLEYAMLIGGGSAGQLVLRDISTTTLRNIQFKCIIDDDKDKWNCMLEDVPIVGGRDQILPAVAKYGITKIFIAIPSLNFNERCALLNVCQETGCEVKLLPGYYQFSNDEVSLSQMRTVSVDDLLGRDPVNINQEEIKEYVQGKVILVTGGGGSMGSELCRQLATFAPKRLVIFDINENNVYLLQLELKKNHPEIDVAAFVGSVRDTRRVAQVFDECRPEIVFHAAGHKHLSLMEGSPCEALKNNVIGTYKTAYIAMAYGCRHFILLSSDKAVNPTSILGAASRLCELLMQTFQTFSSTGQLSKLFSPNIHAWEKMPVLGDSCSTEFTTIRFGTVLGSEGSVFQLFQKQIANGGPVLISDKEATRFCMSITETVRLILQSVAYSQDGDIFVLDMGTPYRIDDIARKLIRLNGLEPEVDIAIQYTGLRPGEKLREEPLMWEEGMRKTPCNRIYIANPTRMECDEFIQKLLAFFKAVRDNCDDVQERITELVNSYHMPDMQNSAPFAASTLVKAQEPINNLERIALKFNIEGEVVAAIPMNKGYINRTYRIDMKEKDGTLKSYTLQRINTNVFSDAWALMDNFAQVTTHLQKHFRLPGRPDTLANQLVIQTQERKNFYEDESGAWRMLSYIGHVHSYDIPENSQVFYNAGQAFGAFLKGLEGLDPASIHEVLPHFHDTFARYQALEEAVKANPVGRATQVQPELDFVRRHVELFKIISNALQNGDIPLRLGHNDCNLNNVLFDDETNAPVAVIDLDTVMPSTPLYDFGDSMRIGTNPAKDDEKDLSKVWCDLNLYEQYANGWLEQCGKMLTPRELELLPYAALVITAEDGIRFLMDHVNGDTYYYIFYQGQNLDRARTQLKLLEDMEAKLPKIKQILSDIYARLGLNTKQ